MFALMFPFSEVKTVLKTAPVSTEILPFARAKAPTYKSLDPEV